MKWSILRTNVKLLGSILIASTYFISCYPQKEILGRWPNGKVKVVRHHKRGEKFNERFVEYYDNGKKKYVRYWLNNTTPVYKTKGWYRNGTKRLVGWRKYKDTSRTYYPADSEYIFTGLCKEYVKEWNENGTIKFESVIQGNLLICNYYNEKGERIKQDVETLHANDGYDSAKTAIRIGANGRIYDQPLRPDYLDLRFFDDE